MYTLGLFTLLACVLCLLLTPLTRQWSIRLGLVDRPDNARKTHARATPRTGGVPILLSYLGSYALLLLLPLGTGGIIAAHRAVLDRLLGPLAMVFVTGLFDDWLELKPWQKLLGQVGAAGWACAEGVRILGVGGYALPLWLSCAITVGWLVLCSNAFNLIDA